MTSTHADINLPSSPPPQPLAQTAQVQVGGKIEIPLRGVSRSGQQLSFLIRSRPMLGTLSEVSISDRHSGTLIYSHNPALGAGIDRFRYAVQAPGTGVSTPAEVIIRVVDRPPVFEGPQELEFPLVASGKTRTKVITLRNDGGGTINGQIELPEPWVFTDGDGTYRITEDGSVEIAITFAPQEPGHFTGTATYSHTTNRQLSLVGEAFSPVDADTPLEFQLGPDGLQRHATLRLRNRTDEKKLLDINAPDELGGPREVEIRGQEEIEVELQTKPDFLAPLEGMIGIVGDGVDFKVPFRFFAAPAKLAIAKPESDQVDFGSVLQGRSVRAEISIHNVGGADANLNGTLPHSISIEPPIVGEPLRPGEKRAFTLTFVGTEPEAYDELLEISDAEGSKAEWRLQAKVEPDARFASGPVIRKPISPPTPTGGQTQPKSTAAPRPQAAYPAVEEIRLTKRTKHSLEAEWDNPATGIVRYDVLLRRIDFSPQGEMKIIWEPVKNATVRVGSPQSTLQIEKLRPGQRITIAIIGYDEQGRASEPSPPFIFDSEHSKPIHIPWIPIGILLAIGCGYLIWRERRLQRQDLDEQVRKINRWR